MPLGHLLGVPWAIAFSIFMCVFAYIALLKRLSYNYAKRKASEILEKVGLGQKGKDQPATLSGGERQRVAIARAMVSMPSLILADEPTGNLDRVNARKIFKMILSLVNDHGSTLIVATHDLELAALCNDRRVLA